MRQFQVLPNIPVLVVAELCWNWWNVVVWEVSYQNPTNPQDVSLACFVKKSICELPPIFSSSGFDFKYPQNHSQYNIVCHLPAFFFHHKNESDMIVLFEFSFNYIISYILFSLFSVLCLKGLKTSTNETKKS